MSGVEALATGDPDDGASDSISFTSTLPDVFNVRLDDSAPPVTALWVITNHFTGEMIVDDDQTIPPAPAVPTTPAIPTNPL